MTMIQISVVCCGPTEARYSQIVATSLDEDALNQRVLQTVEQNLAAGEERDLHNAAHHPEHGPVTYLQQVNEGGFSVFVGPPGQLRETFFGPGSWVGFMDDQGPGHRSKVGPEGVRRTLRVLKGHLALG